MRCSDCYWFYHPSSRVRLAKTCQELGERPSSKVCKAFEANEREEDVPKPAAPVADVRDFVRQEFGSLVKMSHEELFKEVAAEQFAVKQDAYLAMLGIKTILQQQGARAEMDDREFTRYVDKLTRLYLLHRLVLVLGMAPYLDQILSNEIDNLFRPASTPERHLRGNPLAKSMPTRSPESE